MNKQWTVDASVAVKWLNQTHEPHAKEALRLLQSAVDGDCNLLTSDLLPHEALNALIRGKSLRGQALEEAVEVFFSLPLKFISTDVTVAAHAAVIAETYKMTFYDAVYVAIAIIHDAPLVTDNIKHQGKADAHVIAIQDFE